MNTPVEHHLIVGTVLFALGMIGFLTRRNLILITLSAELMLHGVSLNFLAFSRLHGTFEGQAMTAFVLTVAACEAGLALSIVLALYQRRKSLDVRLWSELAEAEADDTEPPVPPTPPVDPSARLPHLAPAGRAPTIVKQEAASRV